MNSKSQDKLKRFSSTISGENKEHILRKTLIYEDIERPVPRLVVQPTFPKWKRRKRRKSVILTRCEDLMEALWEDGYHYQTTWDVLRHYIVVMVGGFRTTVTDYLGKRAKYYRSRGREGVLKKAAKKGYLERFGFIVKVSPKLVNLLHVNVDRPYHYEQTNIVNFSLSLSTEADERTIGAIAPTKVLTTTTTKRERENQLLTRLTQNNMKHISRQICKPTLSAEERRILEAAKGES